MFMFQISKTEEKDPKKYVKLLGWNEMDEDGDSCLAAIIVYDAGYGFNVLRHGSTIRFLAWFKTAVDAIEYSVDLSRKEIADHELHSINRPLAEKE
jgi:hypothetical protein